MINRINMKMNYILIFQIYDNFEYMDKNYIDYTKNYTNKYLKMKFFNIALNIFFK